jgi:GNAT superfamily N-acetyltransferase
VLEISLVPPMRATDAEFVAWMVGLVNRVYAEGERGLWRDGAYRTDEKDMVAIVEAGQLAAARLDGQIVGVVRVQQLDERTGEFGMLAASPDRRGIGVGRSLVTFAEQWAREQDLVRMQLELLVPQGWVHPMKTFLHDWYTRIGYRAVRTISLAEAYPALQLQLAAPCDFVVYHRSLST